MIRIFFAYIWNIGHFLLIQLINAKRAREKITFSLIFPEHRFWYFMQIDNLHEISNLFSGKTKQKTTTTKKKKTTTKNKKKKKKQKKKKKRKKGK